MRPSFRLLPLLGLCSLVFACHRISEADKKAALKCVADNLTAMQAGDVDGVMATIHSRSPSYEGTADVVRAIQKRYKLKFILEKATVERASTDGINIRFMQVTERLSGPDDLGPPRIEGIHSLKLDGDKWKIWSTQVLTPMPPPKKVADEDADEQ